jgi:hypothetical protein
MTQMLIIEKILCGNPTVLFIGNGVHMYLSVQTIILEQEEIFSKFDQPSKAFLKFSEQRLTNNKSDPAHNPSFKLSLMRIPESYNSKCIQKNNEIGDSTGEIKIIQRWDGYRPTINPLLYEFYIWITGKKITDLNKQHESMNKKIKKYNNANIGINWIERLSHTLIADQSL